MRYRIRIEKWDDQHNLLTQSQAVIPVFNEFELDQHIDIIELHFKQLLKQFREYEQNQSR